MIQPVQNVTKLYNKYLQLV